MDTLKTEGHRSVFEEGVNMREVVRVGREPGADFVDFVTAGVHAKGEFHCAECGYGVTVYKTLPVCPMCAGTEWEQSAWSPLTRARTLQ